MFLDEKLSNDLEIKNIWILTSCDLMNPEAICCTQYLTII